MSLRPAASIALFLHLGCTGDKSDDDPTDTGAPTDGDADTDADADSDADADADADSDADTDMPDLDSHLRVLHVAPGLPPQDLLGNGNPGNPAMVGLAFLDAFPATGGWVSRPPNTYTYELFDTKSEVAWASVEETTQAGAWYSLVLIGTRDADTGSTLPAPSVLSMEDPRSGIPAGQFRIRWTHAAVSLADRAYALRDGVTGATYATLDYGTWTDADLDPVEMSVYVDLDDDGACDAGEAFQAFTRTANEFFHVLLVTDEAGELVLVGHTDTGTVPLRIAAPCP